MKFENLVVYDLFKNKFNFQWKCEWKIKAPQRLGAPSTYNILVNYFFSIVLFLCSTSVT